VKTVNIELDSPSNDQSTEKEVQGVLNEETKEDSFKLETSPFQSMLSPAAAFNRSKKFFSPGADKMQST